MAGGDDTHVTLVNPETRFTERPRLHQVAPGQQLTDLQIPDLLKGTAVAFVQGWVMAVDVDARTVRIDDTHTLRYNTRVYSLGSVADAAASARHRRFRLHVEQPLTTRRYSPSSSIGCATAPSS